MNKDKLTHEEIVTKVMEALESIRPFLNNDGGDIELVDVIDNRVMVKLQGNCSGCPMSFSTMKLGVEKYHQTICTKHQRSGECRLNFF